MHWQRVLLNNALSLWHNWPTKQCTLNDAKIQPVIRWLFLNQQGRTTSEWWPSSWTLYFKCSNCIICATCTPLSYIETRLMEWEQYRKKMGTYNHTRLLKATSIYTSSTSAVSNLLCSSQVYLRSLEVLQTVQRWLTMSILTLD